MQNSAADSSANNVSLPSVLQHLPIDKPLNSDAISPSPIQDTMSGATTIQREGSKGEEGKGREKSSENIGTPSQLNSVVEGSDDGETVEVAIGDIDAVEKPMVEVGHKRMASTEFIPRFKSFSIHLQDVHPNRNSHEHVNSPPISIPTGQQLNDQLVPQEEGGEGNEKVKGNEGSPIGVGIPGLDLNQKTDGMENSPNVVEQETEVEPFVAKEIEVKPSVEEEMEVEPYAADNNEAKPSAVEKNEVEPNAAENNEVKPSAIEENELEPHAAENNDVKSSDTEKNEMKPSATEKNEVEHSAIEKNEVEPSAAADNIEVKPYSTEKHEVRPSTTNKNEVESSLTEKTDDFPKARVFKFDLNELPPEDDEN